ncbi:hypothetical protein AL755_17215 [Arthrobacter sp. ERGS1:01]|uniref:DivIVA domain-containing protein n=1 Tax=Arthrobacter sp. ERGS1:01 TaxID=1704044 RepID=UPI0006CB5299|nr:DivIVA domain-containing protein [Arthrobacter sp. ERGS1:01]ALE06792.1 hypothetical protein AL755_17215 [Arthrobacter sp. ERGS1:01]
MTYFLIFLAVMLAAAVAVYVVGLKKPDDDSEIYHDGLGEPVSGLPPVLLPAQPAPADVDKLRFALGLRGYRMDQVDEVLDRLRDELAAKDLRIAELEGAAGSVTATVDAVEPGTAVAAAPAPDADAGDSPAPSAPTLNA